MGVGGLLLGLAEGYGNYLTQEGLLRQKRAEDEALLMRQKALAKFQTDESIREAEAKAPIQKGIISHTANENRVSTALELKARGEVAAATAAAEESRDIRKEQREFEIWKKKNDITLSADKAKAAYQAQLDIEKSLKTQGYKVVGTTIDAETGTQVFTLQDAGGNITTYDSGVVVQKPETKMNEFGVAQSATVPKPTKPATRGFRDGGSAATGTGMSESRPTRVGQEPQQISPAEYTRMVNEAISRGQRGDPEWKGLGPSQIRKKLEDRARAKGLSLPPVQ